MLSAVLSMLSAVLSCGAQLLVGCPEYGYPPQIAGGTRLYRSFVGFRESELPGFFLKGLQIGFFVV